jgi:hypothetical protein
MPELITNTEYIDNPSEIQIDGSIKNLSSDNEFSITIRRPNREYLKFNRISDNTFVAEYQVDFPLTRYRSSEFEVTFERAARILYFYSKYWSPKDFEEIKWVNKTIIDKTTYIIKWIARTASVTLIMTLFLYYFANFRTVDSPFAIKISMLIGSGLIFLSRIDELYLWIKYDKPVGGLFWQTLIPLPLILIYFFFSEIIF